MLEIGIRLLFGAAAGGLLGWVLGRARTCSGQACQARGKLIFSIFGGAVFGAGVAWYLMHQ